MWQLTMSLWWSYCPLALWAQVVPFEIWTLREVECNLKCEDITACAALPNWEVFAEMPSNSIMTSTGIMMVQQRLSMMEVSITSEERRILVLTKSTVYPGTIGSRAQVAAALCQPWAQGQWEHGEVDNVSHLEDCTRLHGYLHHAYICISVSELFCNGNRQSITFSSFTSGVLLSSSSLPDDSFTASSSMSIASSA